MMTRESASGATGARLATAIRVQRLTKFFRAQPAVSDLSLEVPEGAVYGLLGENGAGKTTTLQLLLGLLVPDGGSLEVLGLDPASYGLELRRRVGYVPEVPVLYDWMNVGEIGWFAAGFHPDAQGETSAYLARFSSLAEGFGLPKKQKIKSLSKGMRAKVSLALALASDPALLILDEPTSGLDVLVRREFLESMVDLAGEGRTVLLSSHQIGEVERVASHVALLHKGKLLLAEPLDDLRARTFLLEVRFTGRDHPDAPPLALPLELIDADDAPRQCRWLVHARERSACEAVRALEGVDSLLIETPSLEDIYIGYMRARRPSRPPSPAPAVHVA
jgi:ABC-2 type transport system ATP-binding protein